ncbi:hypothetical protein PAXINDRAFT_19811 [Paxillus involutus ATCC 200175]|uniref:Uncharacterized protein n=1 Tax=Paxillus involutus ATCC 200175 TaxID=664439 RepID=A0A0C9TI48_PAXIN|nr:hypothetical protein PAXINDRAFT_19811 [Paxillus involutus ATCC 200175]
MSPPSSPAVPIGPRPDYQVNCSTCGRELEWTVCQSNAKGNRGRWQVRCYNHKEGQQGFHRWGSPKTPTSSPNPEDRPPSPPPLPLPKRRPGCAVAACKNNQINKKCHRHACKKHCQQMGGCDLPAHSPLGNADGAGSLPLHDPDAGPAALPQQPQPPQTDRSGRHAAESEEIVELFSETEPVAPCRPANSRTKVPSGSSQPRHAVQMPSVFTDQLAEEQALHEERHRLEAERIESLAQAKHSITVYAWLEDGKAPRVFDFQAGSTNSGRSNAVFIWPRFYLNYEVLSTLGLPAVLPSSSAVPQSGVELYNLVGREWRGIRQNHLVVLSEGDVILLKAAGVYNCFNINYYIDKAAGAINNSVPDVRSGLRGERKSVQDAPHQARLLPYSGVFGPMLKPARRGVVLSSSKQEVDARHGLTLSSSEQEVDALLASDDRKRKPTHSPRSQSSGDEPEIVSVTFVPPQPEVRHDQSHLSRSSGKLSIPPRHHTHSHSLISDSSVHEPSPGPSRLRARRWKITRSAFSRTPSPEPGPSRCPSLDRQLRHRTPSPQHQASAAPSSDASTHPSESSHGNSPGGTSVNPIDVDDVQVWPGDYYVCDIVWGFERCEKARRLRTGVPKEFMHLFGKQFMKTTFHTHKKRWYTAPQHVRERFISYGKTEKGLWQNFIEYMNKDTKNAM